jgi:RNA polymerase sigma-70 factor (sigma-E family)
VEPVPFEQFARERGPALLRLAAVLAGDRSTAEDVVQEVLIRVARRWTAIAAMDARDGYVRRMVVNEYLSWRRKWGRLVPSAVITADDTVPDHATAHAQRAELSQLLDQISPKQRAVLVLRFYEDLDDAAIAGVLGCSVGTVRSHASRGLAFLRANESVAHPHLSTSVHAREGKN